MRKRLGWLLCAALCTGCTALPAEERSFAVALGIDRDPQGQWTAYARIPNYQTGGGYATVRGEGESLAEALSAADVASPMQLNLGQLRLIVCSDALAGSDAFPDALVMLSSRQETRLDASVAVTDASLQALMDALTPSTGTRLSKSLDVMMETRIAQGTILPARLSDVIRMGGRQSPVLMRMSLEGKKIALGGCWPVSVDGRITQSLTEAETQLLSLMLGQMRSGALSLPEGVVRLADASVETELRLPTMDGASVRLSLRCPDAAQPDDAIERRVAAACLALLNRLSAMGCDALGLGRQAIRHVSDMAQWQQLDWPGRCRELQWAVSVGVTGPTE